MYPPKLHLYIGKGRDGRIGGNQQVIAKGNISSYFFCNKQFFHPFLAFISVTLSKVKPELALLSV